MRTRGRVALVLCAAAVAPAAARGAALSIYEIQYTADPAGDSPHAGAVVDCLGGVVTHRWIGGLPRLYLQDPARADWAGVMVKDWTGGGLVNSVVLGDWVSLTDVYVEESVGNTTLMYHSDYGSAHQLQSTGNPLPTPVVVTCSAIAAPGEGPPGEWHVADHAAERYEHMLLTVEDVTVAAMDLGKAADNYILRGPGGAECWAADYMNEDIGPDDYHPSVHLGAAFDSVTGVFEQYTKLTAGWDYYQLVTRRTSDLVPEPAWLTILLPAWAVRRRRRLGGDRRDR